MTKIRSLLASQVRFFLCGLGGILLCSCSTAQDSPHRELPAAPVSAETFLNRGAGCGDWIFVRLLLENQESLLFAVDTGSAITILDKSLEPRLGKSLGSKTFRYLWYPAATMKAYQSPPLFLGGHPLRMGDRIWTDDLSRIFPGRPVSGILGMDCLGNYCVQLDFTAGKIRFLDPAIAKNSGIGRAFRLAWQPGRNVHVDKTFGDFPGAVSRLDTGCYYLDGALQPKYFGKMSQKHPPISVEEVSTATGTTTRRASFATGNFAGETYTNLTLDALTDGNVIGLRFLARHLATLNFPEGLMYLQRTNTRSSAISKVPEPTLGWWESEEPSIPPADAERLAALVLSAPNLRPADPLPEGFWWANSRPDFIPLQLPVGHPEARLKALHLPTRHYGLEFISKLKRDNRDEVSLSIECLPKEEPSSALPRRGTIVLLHDFFTQKESLVPWAYILAQNGYGVILVDIRGHGASYSRLISYGKWETADLSQALDALIRQRIADSTVGVLGVGYGATLALHWAARDPRVGTVVAMAPYDQLDQVFKRIAREKAAQATCELLPQALALVAEHLQIRWPDWSGRTGAAQSKHPVFLVGAGKDYVSLPEDLEVIAGAAPKGSRSMTIPDATHGNLAFWFHELAPTVLKWFHQHLATPSGDESTLPR